MMIMITAAGAFFGSGVVLTSGADMAKQLAPTLGSWANVVFSIGFFAAGMSSAITAPLAAGYAIAGILGWKQESDSRKLRLVWSVVILAGVVSSTLGVRPVEAIVFAQAANGILLPMMAIFLLWVMNDPELLREHRNGTLANLFGDLVVLVALLLGVKGVLDALGVI